MSSRDEILASIRANRPQLERTLPTVPLFDADQPASVLAAFKESLERMGGVLLDAPDTGDTLAAVRAKIANAKVVCSTVAEIAGNRDIARVRAPQDVADVDFAIVRAAFGVAETGAVLLSDKQLRVNAIAYLAQHLIVLLDPADIVINLHHAYRRPEFRNGHYAAFHAGPSATADIEGVLIHGAQGVRSLSVLPLRKTNIWSRQTARFGLERYALISYWSSKVTGIIDDGPGSCYHCKDTARQIAPRQAADMARGDHWDHCWRAAAGCCHAAAGLHCWLTKDFDGKQAAILNRIITLYALPLALFAGMVG